MPAQNEALKALIAKAAAKASEDEFHAAKRLKASFVQWIQISRSTSRQPTPSTAPAAPSFP